MCLADAEIWEQIKNERKCPSWKCLADAVICLNMKIGQQESTLLKSFKTTEETSEPG